MPDKRYTKVEEEVLQILDKMDLDDEPSPRPPLRLVKPAVRKPRLVGARRILDLPWLSLAATGVLAFVALMFKDSSEPLATLFAILSILAFVSPIVWRRPGTAGAAPPHYGTKLWRGRDITLEPPRTISSGDRARRWLDRRRGGRH